jgi:hypothetical protein
LVAVTVTADTARQMQERMAQAAAAGADIVELRLDHLREVNERVVRELIAARPGPVIVTIRAAWEGGKFGGTEADRLRMLKEAVTAGAEYVDLEYVAWRDHRDVCKHFMEAVPPGCLVVLDEAYYEFVNDPDYPNGLEYRKRYPNIVLLRTFSKAYGLAGLRVGYGIARPDIIDYLNRVRAPFNVSSVAQTAGIAALGDEEFVRRSRELVHRELPLLAEGVRRLGATVPPSQSNFVFADFPGRDARKLFDGLLREGVVTRPLTGFGFPSALRINTGRSADNQRAITALEKVLRA